MKHITLITNLLTNNKYVSYKRFLVNNNLYLHSSEKYSLHVKESTHQAPHFKLKMQYSNIIWHSTDEGTTTNRTTENSTVNEASKSTTPIPNEETMSDLTMETVKETSTSTISREKDASTKASPVTEDEIRKFINHSFPVDAKVHSFYGCQAEKCATLSKDEQQRMKTKDRFQHQWIFDTTLSYCNKTGYHWLLFQEGEGMFCILCRQHDTVNPQNKSKKFNSEPSVR